MDWSTGDSESFVTTEGLRIYILKGYLTLGKMYVYVTERSPNESDVWLQHVKGTRGTSAEPVSPALAHYAIQFSDYFQGFARRPSF